MNPVTEIPLWFAVIFWIATIAWLYTLFHWPQERCKYCPHCRDVAMWEHRMREDNKKKPPPQDGAGA